jgi:hypothetical protein
VTRPSGGAGQEQSDPERVLSQALRAMAGGRPGSPVRGRDNNGADATPGRRRGRLTAAQVLLIAAIIGLVIGMAVALVMVAVG